MNKCMPSDLVYHRVNKGRESLKYVWTRSFCEGVSKALINFKSSPLTTLSTEDLYLRYLLEVAIASKPFFRCSQDFYQANLGEEGKK